MIPDCWRPTQQIQDPTFLGAPSEGVKVDTQCFSLTPVAQPFICNAEKEKLSEPAGPAPSRTHHTSLGQGHHYTELTSDRTGVHHTEGIKQSLAADVVEDLIKFSFCHISESLPPTCTDTEALISLSGEESVCWTSVRWMVVALWWTESSGVEIAPHSLYMAESFET